MSDPTPFADLAALASLLSTDEFVVCRDGQELKRATLAALFTSPALTGNPTAPTQTAGNSSTRIATTAFVQTALLNRARTDAVNEFVSGQIVGSGASSAALFIDGAAGQLRSLTLRTAGVARWSLFASSDAESGSDAGSTLSLMALDDAGTLIDVPMTLVRAAGGDFTFNRDINLGSGEVLKSNGTQVVEGRKTGWAAQTGTATRTAYATYAAPDISTVPTEAEVQAIADALQAADRRLKALTDDLIAHGLIGA